MFWRVLFGTNAMLLFTIEFVGNDVVVKLFNKKCHPCDQASAFGVGVVAHFIVNTAKAVKIVGPISSYEVTIENGAARVSKNH